MSFRAATGIGRAATAKEDSPMYWLKYRKKPSACVGFGESAIGGFSFTGFTLVVDMFECLVRQGEMVPVLSRLRRF
jgi:hypothetical protein